jgi:hypothetical protein
MCEGKQDMMYLIIGAILLFANGMAAQTETAVIKNPAAIKQQVAAAQQKESVSAVPEAQKEGDKKNSDAEEFKKQVNSWCLAAFERRKLSKGTDATPIALEDLQALQKENAGKSGGSNNVVAEARLSVVSVLSTLEEAIKDLQGKIADLPEGTTERSSAQFCLQVASEIKNLVTGRKLDKGLITLVGRLTLNDALNVEQRVVEDPIRLEELTSLVGNYAFALGQNARKVQVPPFVTAAVVCMTLNSICDTLAVRNISKKELEKALSQQIQALGLPLSLLSVVIHNLENAAKEAEKTQ